MKRKIKFKYSVKDKRTGWYTKYRTRTAEIEIPVNEYNTIIVRELSENVKKYIASQTTEKFQLLTIDF